MTSGYPNVLRKHTRLVRIHHFSSLLILAIHARAGDLSQKGGSSCTTPVPMRWNSLFLPLFLISSFHDFCYFCNPIFFWKKCIDLNQISLI
ncbi:hypothetical protein DM01DRAFT_1112295 [Hesseltinella vesiculosa]|uniref:Uncharacterized protein n=1 Tax=Hesseltinella vesiculosa TaxID=101127 RepID=A0A1X2G9T9_9FUNG|nr:hypothetical protein DM01DRAFT_1112295 [Hesseltinella vesiculosa]